MDAAQRDSAMEAVMNAGARPAANGNSYNNSSNINNLYNNNKAAGSSSNKNDAID